jgi:Lipopolysaccharide-assembly
LVYLNVHYTVRLKNMELKSKNLPGFHMRRLYLIILIAEVLISNGCSVKYSFTGASISKLAKTFSVIYFQNRAPIVQPGLSQSLTDALIDKCKAQTSLKYISGTGDMNFEGEITEYNTRPLTVAANATAAMNRFTIAVKVKFTNAVEPDYSFDQTFSRFEDYDSNIDLSAVESDLSGKIVDMIVEDIFNKAFVNW